MLTAKQSAFVYDHWARINILEGAVRSGKTYVLNYITPYLALKGPKGKGAIIAKTLETLRENILDPMKEILGSSMSYSNAGRRIYIEGRRIRGVGANDEKSQSKIRGDTLAWAVGDELTLWPKSFFDMLLTRLSPKGAILFGSTNTDSPFHWLKTEYIDRAGEISIKSTKFLLEDNTSLDPGYVKSLKAELTGVWYQRFILGLWVLAEGVIYDALTDDHFQDLSQKHYVHHIIGIDYGTSNPTVFLDIGFSSYDNIGVVDEYYYDSRLTGRQKTDNEYGDDFDKWAKDKQIAAIYCDPSAASFIQELRRRSWPVIPAENDVLDGIRLVSRKISKKQILIDPNKCPQTKKEMQTYSWDPAAQKRGEDKPLKEHDHAPDAIRYPVFSCLSGRSVMPVIVSGGTSRAYEDAEMYTDPINYGAF